MKSKLIITGISDQEDLMIVIFKKTKNFFKSFSELAEESFGVAKLTITTKPSFGKKGNACVPKKIESYVDFHEKYDKKFRINIFYGKNKVFLIFNCKNKDKVKFKKDLGKFCSWEKIRKSSKKV